MAFNAATASYSAAMLHWNTGSYIALKSLTYPRFQGHDVCLR